MRNIIKIESNERVIENNHLSNLKYLSTNIYHLYVLVCETSVLYEESTQESVHKNGAINQGLHDDCGQSLLFKTSRTECIGLH